MNSETVIVLVFGVAMVIPIALATCIIISDNEVRRKRFDRINFSDENTS